MANRGRDLELSIISNANQFDLDKPADDLDNLGDAATTSAKKIDTAFDRIATSSRTSMRKVDKDLDRGKKGLNEFKDEANSTARESAASFSGSFDDVASTIQEVAANAFAGFGPLGAAAGLAAAAGLGIIVSQIQEAKQKLTELTQSFTTLRREGIDPAADAASHMVDELDAGQLAQFKREAEELGIPLNVLRDALDGNGDALSRVRAAIDAGSSGLEKALGINDYTALTEQLNQTEQAYKDSADSAALAGQNASNTATQVDALSSSYGALSGQIDSVNSSIRDAGDASSALAEDIAKDGKITAAGILKALQDTAAAQKTYKNNLAKTLAEGGAEFAAWVAEQGPEVAQGYINGSKSQRAAVRAAFNNNVGAAAGEGITAGLASQTPAARAQAANMRREIADAVGGSIPAPTIDFTLSARAAVAHARRVHAEIADVMNQPIPTSRTYP